jgi:pimeloyl-ACP methyl ester carboxylesterase
MPPSAGNRQIGKPTPPPTVSAGWLLAMGLLVVLGAALCGWAALGYLFWQGSWQLLYHPSAAIARTPASAGLAYNDVAFATTEDGIPRLKGWWISAPQPHLTVLYLHGGDGNLGDSVAALAQLHAAGVNILAFDYRGYGASAHAHPSEAHWRQDADWAVQYLTGTRHVAADTIVLAGQGLGANLALEVAAAHPEVAGVILDQPLDAPAETIFRDPRAQLVPSHLLVKDRWDMTAPAIDLRIPSLWFYRDSAAAHGAAQATTPRVTSSKMIVWLPLSGDDSADRAHALAEWLDGLRARR